ncbi:MAG TPA: hypothetical protein VFZ38_10760 [Vicinamibacterales bacterium]
MTEYRILVARPEDIDAIVADARQADIDEVMAASGRGLADVMAEGLERSRVAWTGFAKQVPICMFGVAPAAELDGVGVPWMIGTNAVEAHASVFLRRSRDVLDQMRELFPVLINYVGAENATAVRWLRWMGFNLHPAEPYGLNGEMFHRFDLGAVHV